jgi:UPF0148 protein
MSEGSMKEMAELLRKGASMLGESCPICGTPLFKLRNGEIICPNCNRPIRYVEPDEDTERITQKGSLEATIMRKITEVQRMLEDEKEPQRIRDMTSTLMALLEALEKVKKIE